jgi:hypothetical protein
LLERFLEAVLTLLDSVGLCKDFIQNYDFFATYQSTIFTHNRSYSRFQRFSGATNYPWQNAGDAAPKDKVVGIRYFKPIDWVIGVGTFEDEFRKSETTISKSMNWLIWSIVISGIIILIVMAIFAIYASGKISNPIIKATSLMEYISAGKVNEASKLL